MSILDDFCLSFSDAIIIFFQAFGSFSPLLPFFFHLLPSLPQITDAKLTESDNLDFFRFLHEVVFLARHRDYSRFSVLTEGFRSPKMQILFSTIFDYTKG